MVEIEYEPVATSTDGTFNLEDADLDGGDHLLVVQATDEDGEVSAYSDETVYSQEHSTYAIEKTTLTAIADSVRAKTGKTDPIPTENLPAEIESITTGITPTGTIPITSNGEYDVTAYAKADVQVSTSEHTTEEVKVTPTKSVQTVTPRDATCLSKVTVYPIPDSYVIPTGTIPITSNGEGINVAGYATANVQVPTSEHTTEEVKVTPTTMPQVITPANADYISKVIVEAIPNEYLQYAKVIPELIWTPKETLDFSMIPNSLRGLIHWIYFTLPNSGSSDSYIGLRINDGELKALPYADYPSEVTLYDTNGWVDAGYKSFHCAAGAVSVLLYKFGSINSEEPITFSVGSVEYTAAPGMTWSEWMISDYNTGDIIIRGSSITTEFAPSDFRVCTAGGTAVTTTDEIIADHAYILAVPTNISFSIGSEVYLAEYGMTWGEWVASDYNTDGLIISGTNITAEFAPSDFRMCTSDGVAVTTTDEIIADHAYILAVPTVSGTRSFTVYNSISDTTVTFSADAGMTWGEWVESDYNTEGYYVDALAPYTIKSAAGYNVLDSEGAVHRDDAITANGEYTLNVS